MHDREAVKEALKQCSTWTCANCNFWDTTKNTADCGLNAEALALIEELEKEIKQLKESDGAMIVNYGTINFEGR